MKSIFISAIVEWSVLVFDHSLSGTVKKTNNHIDEPWNISDTIELMLLFLEVT